MANQDNINIGFSVDNNQLASQLDRAKKEITSLKGVGKSAGESLNAHTRKVKSGLRDLVSPINSVSQAYSRLGNIANIALGTIAGIAMTRVLAKVADFTNAMVVAPIKIGAAFEQIETDFKVFLGSAEAAKEFVKDINLLAAATPFDSSALMSGAQTLLSYGMETEKILPTLRMLGEVTGANAERFQRMILGFAQASATGRLLGQDLRQMTEAGLSIKDLAGAMGLTVTQFMNMKEEGSVSIEMVQKALEKLTSEGGKYFGRLQEGSQTTLGLWTTFTSNVELTANAIGQLFLPSIKDLIRGLIEIAQNTTTAVTQFVEIEQATGNLTNSLKTLGSLILNTIVGISLVAFIQHLKTLVVAQTALGTSMRVLGLILTGDLIPAFYRARTVVIAFTTALLANPYLRVTAAVVGLTAAFVMFNNSQERLNKEINESKENFIRLKNEAKPLVDEYEELRNKTQRTAQEEERFKEVKEKLIKLFPDFNESLEKEISIRDRAINKIKEQSIAELRLLEIKLEAKAQEQYDSLTPKVGFGVSPDDMYIEQYNKYTKTLGDISRVKSEIKNILDSIDNLFNPERKQGKQGKIASDLLDEKTLKKYEDFTRNLADKRFSIEANRTAQEKLNQSSLNIEEEHEKEIIDLAVRYAKEKRDIELSEAMNKNELIQKLEYNFVLESQDLINKIRKERYQKALEEEIKEMKEAEKQKRELEKLYSESMKDDIDANLKDILASYKFNKLEELKLTKQAEESKLKYINITTKEYKDQLIVIKEIEQQIKENQDRIDQNFSEHLKNLAINVNIASGILRDLAKVGADAINSLSEDITGSLSSTIQDFMNKNKTLGEALKDFFENIKRTIVKMIADMIAEMVKLYILQPLLENMFKNFLQNTKSYSDAISSVGTSFVKIAAAAPAASVGVNTLATAQKAVNPTMQNSKQPMEEIGKAYEKLAGEAKKAALSVAQLAVSQAAYSVAMIPFVGGFLAPAAAAATGTGIAAGAAVATAGMALSNLIGGFFAEGGRPPVGVPSVVGEKGPELFVPDRAGTIIPNNKLSSATGGGAKGSDQINYVYAPQIKTGANAEEVFQVLDRHSKQFFAKIQEGIEYNSGLRNAVKGTR
jgi:tape measure domain-containing protein